MCEIPSCSQERDASRARQNCACSLLTKVPVEGASGG